MPNTNRRKGHDYERLLAEEFRRIGFIRCVTSRYQSKEADDNKVDLCFTEPFNIQAKCSKVFFSPLAVLEEMPKSGWNVVFQKVQRKGEYVTMTKEIFYKLLAKIEKYGGK